LVNQLNQREINFKSRDNEKNDFTLQSLQYTDSVTAESDEDKNDIEECFKADFFLMSDILTKMFKEFLKVFGKSQDKKE
jgi:DNA recombination-dependent growth factor C